MKKLVFAFAILAGVSVAGNAQTKPAVPASHVTTIAKTGRPAAKEAGKMQTNATKSMTATNAATTEKKNITPKTPANKHVISHKRKAHRKLIRKAAPAKRKENKK